MRDVVVLCEGGEFLVDLLYAFGGDEDLLSGEDAAFHGDGGHGEPSKKKARAGVTGGGADLQPHGEDTTPHRRPQIYRATKPADTSRLRSTRLEDFFKVVATEFGRVGFENGFCTAFKIPK